MGGTAQKRLVRKRDLERALSEIEAHPLPNAYLEQYTTPSKVAAEILYVTAYVYDDIISKTVVDLGCGTGRLAIGAALLGAKEVFGVDVDRIAVRVAQKNAEIMGVKEKTHWIAADIDV
ncbi:MAG: 50S ribosomal protein L11 methyltransferase, partial [Candidatus Bathyarchaeota archaeon]|nr:50S ribosomal protein L11 methyltransferase [Candidatus Bathyarchaeota archaeon]